MKYIGIIPARYGSTRFPGKPLVEIKGKPMIQRTWEQAKKALEHVLVATDDDRIRQAVESFGGKAVMTSADHCSGTDRCAEASSILSSSGYEHDVVINIQGDEPFIHPDQITLLAGCFEDAGVEIATLVKEIETEEDIFNPNLPKVIFNKNHFAIYFSRSPIPYIRGKDHGEWLNSHKFFRHIGMYGYRSGTLQQITKLGPSSLEQAEMLEQNRWLENGYPIKLKKTTLKTEGVDTPEDLERLNGKSR